MLFAYANAICVALTVGERSSRVPTVSGSAAAVRMQRINKGIPRRTDFIALASDGRSSALCITKRDRPRRKMLGLRRLSKYARRKFQKLKPEAEMKELYTEIEINASPEKVWQVLTDFDHF